MSTTKTLVFSIPEHQPKELERSSVELVGHSITTFEQEFIDQLDLLNQKENILVVSPEQATLFKRGENKQVFIVTACLFGVIVGSGAFLHGMVDALTSFSLEICLMALMGASVTGVSVFFGVKAENKGELLTQQVRDGSLLSKKRKEEWVLRIHHFLQTYNLSPLAKQKLVELFEKINEETHNKGFWKQAEKLFNEFEEKHKLEHAQREIKTFKMKG